MESTVKSDVHKSRDQADVQYRDQRINRALAITALIFALFTAISLLRISSIGWHLLMGLHVALALFWATVALMHQSLNTDVKGLCLVIPAIAVGMAGTLTQGLSGNDSLFMALGAVLAATIWHQPAALWALGIALVGVLLAAAGFLSGTLRYSVAMATYLQSIFAWTYAIAAMLVLLVPAVYLIAIQRRSLAEGTIKLMDGKKTLRQIEQKLSAVAVTDSLTGMNNRRSAEEKYNIELQRGLRYGYTSALLYIDLDRSKRINEELGQAAGDAVIRQCAAVLKDSVREHDITARHGGEEFTALLPNLGSHEAMLIAERIRLACENQLKGADGRPCTVSIGIACQVAGESLGALFATADSALRQAKNAGRNQSRCLSEIEGKPRPFNSRHEPLSVDIPISDQPIWRESAADHAVLMMSFVAAPMVILSQLPVLSTGWQPVMALSVSFALLWAVTALRRRYLSSRIKTLILCIPLIFSGLFSLVDFGLLGAGMSALASGILLLGALSGFRAAASSLAVCLLATVIIAIAFDQQLLHYNFDIVVYLDAWQSWLLASLLPLCLVLPALTVVSMVKIRLADTDERLTALVARLERAQNDFADAIRNDALTGLWNRHEVEQRSQAEFLRGTRDGHSCCLLYINIEGLRTVNEKFGQARGDSVLNEFASMLQTHSRSHDLVGRWADHEFVVFLPRADVAEAVAAAERMVTSFANEIELPDDTNCTISIGVVGRDTELSFGDLMSRADRALGEAKQQGSDCVRTL